MVEPYNSKRMFVDKKYKNIKDLYIYIYKFFFLISPVTNIKIHVP